MIGIADGAVLQRGSDNTCEIYLCNTRETAVTYTGFGSGAADAVLLPEERVRVTGIPVGGPYTVTVGKEKFSDIYVGDVWILGGQSNMEGNGRYRDSDREAVPDAEIRAFYIDGKWAAAKHPLHRRTDSFCAVHTAIPGMTDAEMQWKGVGPGISFAKTMRAATGVPQGLLCCAHGGTTMNQWAAWRIAEGENSLSGALLLSVRNCGGNAAGLFWFQGCSEAMGEDDGSVLSFASDTMELFSAIRRHIGKEIPIVQAQIARMTSCWSSQPDVCFSKIREQQRIMPEKMTGLATVPTYDLRLDDLVHLNADSQDTVGLRAATAMQELILGEKSGFLPQPRYAGYTVAADSCTGLAVLTVSYDYVAGSLCSDGRAVGFSVGDSPFGTDNRDLFDTALEENRVILRLQLKPENLQGKYLRYAAGANPVANIRDAAGRQIPAMAAIRL